MIIKIVIIMLCIVAIAFGAFAFWLWRKRKAADSAKWQTISVMTTLEKEKDAQIHNLRIRNSLLNHEIEAVELKNRELQDSLSSALCPTNNHIWVDGVCKRCGREK
jgi:hypothetical protein